MWNSEKKRYFIFSMKETEKAYIFKPLRMVEDLNLTVDGSKAKVIEDDSTVLYDYLPLYRFLKLKKPVVITSSAQINISTKQSS